MKINDIVICPVDGILRAGVIKKISTVEDKTGATTNVTVRVKRPSKDDRGIYGQDVVVPAYQLRFKAAISPEAVFVMFDTSEDMLAAEAYAKEVRERPLEEPDDVPF